MEDGKNTAAICEILPSSRSFVLPFSPNFFRYRQYRRRSGLSATVPIEASRLFTARMRDR
jgi:hypothetical protein